MRRGAVYAVRFRLPSDVAARINVVCLRRSLHTKDIKQARQRCLLATLWFRSTMEEFRAMAEVSREDLERAAIAFFDQLKEEVDKPRNFAAEHWDEELDFQVSETRRRASELRDQLVSNDYGASVDRRAEELLDLIGVSIAQLSEHLQLIARQLAARSEVQQMEFLEHQLTSPASQFEPSDKLFAQSAPRSWTPLHPDPRVGPTLRQAASDYLRRKSVRGLGRSHITELERSLGWLCEVIGDDRLVGSVTKSEMRSFRDDIERLEVLRGRRASFRDRLTNDTSKRLKSATTIRYWSAVAGFFEWVSDEFSLPENPTSGLKIERRKGERRDSPEPFTTDELVRYLSTPLFTGFRPRKHFKQAGDKHSRGQQFWAGLIPMYTGLRAGELAQLLLEDFVLENEVPHIKVRETNASGERVKSAKTAASIRDVPLHPDLLRLGLAEFLARRRKLDPKGRVFEYFRLGTKGRTSEGMTRFWGDYLKEFGLWKPGRATHVWRHTLVARLREAEVPEEDIAAVVGHSRRTMTASYGGAYSLSRMAGIIAKLAFGVDVVEAVGGPYSAELHRS